MNQREKYTKIFEAFNHFKVLIVGDVMLDAYRWGKVRRISPEAPVPILDCKKREDRLGGAANVAKNIKALGAEAFICTVIGEDATGDKLLTLFENNGLPTEGIIRATDRQTTIKTRYLSGFHHLLRLDEEDTHFIKEEMQQKLYQRVAEMVDTVDFQAIIFQDYDKGVLTPELITKIKSLAKSRKIATVVDPKKRNFDAYGETTLFKPNFKEFTEGAGYIIQKTDLDTLASLGQEYRQQKNIEILLITLSEQGVLVCSEGGIAHIPSKVHEIADVSGAGDTVVATATLCLVAGLQPEEMAFISNMAGSLVCLHPVVVSVDKEVLLKEVTSDNE